MSRKGQSKIRKLAPDTRFQSVVVAKIINRTMFGGNKVAAQKQVYNALDLFQKESKSEDILTSLEQALDNIKPKVEVRPRRIGGAVYQVPTPVRASRQYSLAIRWLVLSARKQFSMGRSTARGGQRIRQHRNKGWTSGKHRIGTFRSHYVPFCGTGKGTPPGVPPFPVCPTRQRRKANAL